MSQMQRRGLPQALFPSVKVLGACALLLTLTGCTELARFMSKLDPKPEEPVVAEQPTPQPAEERVEGPVEKPKPSKLYEWNGDGRKVSRIVIDTDTQRASFFVGEDEIGWSTIASGLPKHPTPTGRFAVMEKVENKRSNLYGKVVKNGKVVRSNAKAGRDPIPAGASFEGARMPYFMRLTYDGIGLHAGPIPRPGQPASHGCIRLPSTLAPVLFKHVSHGTEVTIVGSGPSYGNYVEKQRIAAERAKREAENRRVAQASAAAASPSAEASTAVASTASATTTPRPPADSRSAPQASTTPPAAPPPTSDVGVTAAEPATASPGSVPGTTPESSTASATPRDPSPTSGATASEAAPPTSAPTAEAAPAVSTESAPQSAAEAATAPEQASAESGRAATPDTETTATATTEGPADSASSPARSSPPAAAIPAAPASDPAPAAEAPQSPPATGSEASQAPAAPATPSVQAQQAPAAPAEGSDG
ncbi:L,D-transpeptidase [Thiocapsa bogorovii]|uniref:L,D-transpeptidase n=1 Tax=Thiocapsa bogorovii TaxID=521689 RepID=UPI001E59CA96|nr:L,D-transpeptidase [Thiocapsa bogorovii]UHD15983.1 L,D-transpeptidase family protein [Thiocapsa bogorovii]